MSQLEPLGAKGASNNLGVALSSWGTQGRREQLGFAVSGDEGWIHLGNMAFSVTGLQLWNLWVWKMKFDSYSGTGEEQDETGADDGLCLCLGSVRAGPCSDAAVCSVRQQSPGLEVEQMCCSERGEKLAEVSGLTAQLLSQYSPK